MFISPNITLYTPFRSLSNFTVNKKIFNIIPNINGHKFKDASSDVNILASNRDFTYYFKMGDKELSGVLLDEDNQICPYYVVFLYSVSTGHLVDKTATDEEGNYKFEHLQVNHKYMIVSYDRFNKNNSTIIDFILKEETNE